MTQAPPDDHREAPAWLRWPLRVIAVLLVLPFRLAWEGLRLAGRLLHRTVLTSLAWL
jgi:hypothetical protein